ncbi:hypothetical protein KJ640_08225, partial [bacterium]|nr:hypothetical protein [bacterium]
MKRLWEKWKVLAQRIGNFQARILLSVFYFIIVAPFGLMIRVFFDPLSIKKKKPFWSDKQIK